MDARLGGAGFKSFKAVRFRWLEIVRFRWLEVIRILCKEIEREVDNGAKHERMNRINP